jgi:oxysterol 7-alpha-hydroxylase
MSSAELHMHILLKFFGVTEAPVRTVYEHDNMMALKSLFSKYLFGDKGLAQLTSDMQQHLQVLFAEKNDGIYPAYDFLARLIFEASTASIFTAETLKDKNLYQKFVDFDFYIPICAGGAPITLFKDGMAGRQSLVDTIKGITTVKQEGSLLVREREKLFTTLNLPDDDKNVMQLALLWAASGNTTAIIYWVVLHLLLNKSYMRRVQEEIDTVRRAGAAAAGEGTAAAGAAKGSSPSSLPSSSSLSSFSQDQLNKLITVDAAITEALRLSSGNILMRCCLDSCSLTLDSGNTYNFRKGDMIGMCSALTHLDAEVYDDPTVYNIDRWLVGDTEEEIARCSIGSNPNLTNGKGRKLPPSTSFGSFGGGSGLCPGRRFARNELKIMLVMLFSYFDITLVQEEGSDKPVEVPELDGSRAGLGIFPPKDKSIQIEVKKKTTVY